MIDPDEDEFSEEFLDYARRALEMAGIETDEKLKQTKPIRHSLLHALDGDQMMRYRHARDLCPQGEAIWEQAEFLRLAVQVAISDLQWGAIKTYNEFEFLYSRILSDKALPFLPSVYAAAALSPSLDWEFSNELMRSLPVRYKD